MECSPYEKSSRKTYHVTPKSKLKKWKENKVVNHTLFWHFINSKKDFSNETHINSYHRHCQIKIIMFSTSRVSAPQNLSCKWIEWITTKPKQFESAIASEVIGNFVCSSFNTFALSRTQAVWWMGRFWLFVIFLFHFPCFRSVSVVRTVFVIILFRKYVRIHCHLSCDLGRSSFIAIGRFTFYSSVLVSFHFLSFAYTHDTKHYTNIWSRSGTFIDCPLTLYSRTLLALLHLKYCRRAQSSCRWLLILCVFTLSRTLSAHCLQPHMI